MARPPAHEWRAKAAIWPAKANRQLASSTYAGAFRIAELVSTDVDRGMIACLGSCRARADLAAMIEALSLHPSPNTPVETKRLEAARAAMANWKAYSHACQARHNAHRLRLGCR
jgi:hypothetical protein